MGKRRGPVVLAGSIERLRAESIDHPVKFPGKRGDHDKPGRGKFSGARFEAKLYEAKHLPSGEMRIVLLIPEGDKAEGLKLADAFSCGLMIDVQKKDYRK